MDWLTNHYDTLTEIQVRDHIGALHAQADEARRAREARLHRRPASDGFRIRVGHALVAFGTALAGDAGARHPAC